jgi:hypothetical protein
VVVTAEVLDRCVAGRVVGNNDLEFLTEVDGVDTRVDVGGRIPRYDYDCELHSRSRECQVSP